MMRPLHIASLLLTTLALMMSAAPTALARQAAAPPLAPGEVMSAYRTLDGWVRAWQVPEEPQPTDPDGAAGACVTLRLGGQVLGRATDIASDGQSIWRATRRAMAEATTRAPVPRDALREEALLDMAARITIDLQVAGPLVPLLGESFDDAGGALRPGLDGVAARAAEQVGAVFPGTMIATGLAPAAALRAASAQTGLGPLELDKLRADHGLLVYRFTTLHLAQPGPGEEPVFLHRGGRVVPTTEVGVAALRRLAERIAAHLQSHDWLRDEPAGMLGDYDPIRDAYEPLVATPNQQALTAFALFRFANTPGIRPVAAARAARFGWSILDDLQSPAPGEETPFADATDCAGYIAALLEAPERPPGMAEVAKVGDDAWNLSLETIRRVCSPQGEWSEDLSLGARALVAYALTSVALDPRAAQPGDEGRAREAVRSLFRTVSPGELPTTMPWLAWAELRLAPDGAVPAGEALRDLRSMLWARQVTPTSAAPGDEDQIGGVWFTAARNPFPTWHTFRPGAAVATMFGDPRLTTAEEAPGELARLGLAMRFLSQLTVDDAAMHMFRDRGRTIGGVREAVWSTRMPIEASDAGLMAVCEVLRAVSARSASPAPAAGDSAGESPAPGAR